MTIPSEVVWSASVSALVIAVGVATIVARGDHRRARGLDKLALLGPMFYAAPLAGFGVEHFTRTAGIAGLVPSWIPWHELWTYLIGAGFIAAGFSMVTGILARLSASMVALTFLLFVLVMDAPALARQPTIVGFTLTLRELAFCGGALALASTMTPRSRGADLMATIARYFIAIPVLWFSFEQFRNGDKLAAVPLGVPTPDYVVGGAVWTYLAAVVYAVAGALLLVNRMSREAALGLGATVLLVVLVVYGPLGVVERASLDNGYNFVADTLMFNGAVLLLAGALVAPSRRADSA
jgi:uncharacterized membrane protein YphA (DoxX/SURF4 family)